MVKRLGSSVLGHCVESFLASPSAARSSDQVYHASIQHQGSSPPCTTVPHRSPSVRSRGTQLLGHTHVAMPSGRTSEFSVQVAPMSGGSVRVLVLCCVVGARLFVFVCARGASSRSCFPASSLPLRTSSRRCPRRFSVPPLVGGNGTAGAARAALQRLWREAP